MSILITNSCWKFLPRVAESDDLCLDMSNGSLKPEHNTISTYVNHVNMTLQQYKEYLKYLYLTYTLTTN